MPGPSGERVAARIVSKGGTNFDKVRLRATSLPQKANQKMPAPMAQTKMA
jgi:hypothetical protein